MIEEIRYLVAVPSTRTFHGPFRSYAKARDWAEAQFGKTRRWIVLPDL